MNFKVTNNKLILYVKNIEAGYIEFNQRADGITINQTYIYPGLRENGYAKGLVAYMVDNFDSQIVQVNCAYFRIMAEEYKLSKL